MSLWCSDCDYDMVVGVRHICAARLGFAMWIIVVKHNMTGKGEDRAIPESFASSTEQARRYLYNWYQIAS